MGALPRMCSEQNAREEAADLLIGVMELILNCFLRDVEGFGDVFCLQILFVTKLENLFSLPWHFVDECAIGVKEFGGNNLVVGGGSFYGQMFEGVEESSFRLFCIDKAEDTIADAGVEIG